MLLSDNFVSLRVRLLVPLLNELRRLPGLLLGSVRDHFGHLLSVEVGNTSGMPIHTRKSDINRKLHRRRRLALWCAHRPGGLVHQF